VGSLGLTFAVVAIENVAGAGEEPVRVTDEGETVQVVPLGQILATIRLTVPAKPSRGLRVSVEFPVCPAAGMVMVVGFADILKSVTFTVTGGDVVEPA
jgi:hypothetical protein